MSQIKKQKQANVFDRLEDGDIIDRSQPSVRPKDAATLILIRRDGPKPRVLVGKRSNKHAFMPDKYVFPGGRVDPEDSRAPAITELRAPVEQKLVQGARRKPRAFGLTAVRETFEETGLIIGQPDANGATAPRNWQPFLEEGALPCLQHLEFVGRAITPPYRPKRFDARFFIAEAETALIDERPAASGAELVDVRWIELDDTRDIDLPLVTLQMLDEVRQRLEAPKDPHQPLFLRYSPKGHLVERI
ncbi:NUDIX hydrolase [Ponticaulis sp.]|uniref:NUDIX hydrolase n=1 Tax=Ponticaulis sp. TaxID=2020902 RepID=UPI000C8FC3B7|nr:NUDIX hydrolase [Ponticaulis sp.]MAI89628.1 glycosyltransferase [Ponticaulis sp.]|tara:strand:- start:161814 stop:162551 length:738 start_codon:yes stop_codon:yes gene_type:complete